MIHLLNSAITQRVLSLLLAGGVCLSTSIVHAIEGDRRQPITLEADKATFNEKTGVTTYTGRVVIQQGTLKVEANSLVATLNSEKQLSSINAQGTPAKFQQQLDNKNGLAKGEAKSIRYNAETGIVTLTGNAFLSQNGATFKGENLRYSMNKGDLEADGGRTGRIQIVIPPSAQQSFPGVRD